MISASFLSADSYVIGFRRSSLRAVGMVQSRAGSEGTISSEIKTSRFSRTPTFLSPILSCTLSFSFLSTKMPSAPVTARRETDVEKRKDVWAWYKCGKTYSEISRLEDLTKSTFAKIIQRIKKRTGKDKFSNAKRTGTRPKLTPHGERRLLRATLLLLSLEHLPNPERSSRGTLSDAS